MKTESHLQHFCYTWFRNVYPDLFGLLFAVPNGGRRSVREASIMKATGTVAGIPDMMFCYKGKTTFFEFKTGKGKLSPDQELIIDRLRKQKFHVHVIRNAADFRKVINQLLTPIGQKKNYQWTLQQQIKKLRSRQNGI